MFLLLQAEQNASTARVDSTDLLVIGAIIAATAMTTRLIRPVLAATLTWLARRSRTNGSGRWKVRIPRLVEETVQQAELRRRQRITATAAGMARVLSTLLWITAFVLILNRLDIDPVYAISGAGFVGVALSIGGQHAVNDFLSGLHILLEDRFGEGDELQLKIHDDIVTATVTALGAFATRLHSESATIHVPNREMTSVVNLSQRGATSELRFQPANKISDTNRQSTIEATLRTRYAQTAGFDASRDGLVIDEIKPADDESFTVSIRTARPLTTTQRHAVLQHPDHTD
jgi:small-conductance mechanosensitive channel